MNSAHMHRASIQVPAQAALFDGHFPGHPILPGAKLLDLIIACLRDAAALPATELEVVSAKFLATVAPASQLVLSWTASADGVCRFECSTAEQKVASGVIRSGAHAGHDGPRAALQGG